ncbi:MAG: hypothetical protein LBK46_05540 [Oscillospiraceae bacterium]|jgi:hypothetical protein|nr:hypothetical protein [Oscillospiraceae bacterium]
MFAMDSALTQPLTALASHSAKSVLALERYSTSGAQREAGAYPQNPEGILSCLARMKSSNTFVSR